MSDDPIREEPTFGEMATAALFVRDHEALPKFEICEALEYLLASERRRLLTDVCGWLRSLPAMQAPEALADEIEATMMVTQRQSAAGGEK